MYVDQILNRLSIGIPISMTFLLQFMFVLIFFTSAMIKTKKMNVLVFFSIFTCLIGIVVGMMNGWYVKDILADATRYIIPFLAFYIGLFAVKDTNKAVRRIIKAELLLILITLLIKVLSLLRGEPLIFYGRYFIYVSSLMFFISLYSITDKNYTYISKSKAKFVILIYFLSPILRVSKTNFIVTVLSLGVVKIKYKKLILSIISLIVLFLFQRYELWNALLFERFLSMYESISSGDVFYDSSTGARIGELVNSLMTLVDDPIVNLLFGLGSGALWYQDYIPIISGLNPDNFRSDGGGHHIHMTPIAIIFRHGVVGIVLYLSLLICVLKKIWTHRRKYPQSNDIYLKAVIGFVIVQSISMVFTYSFYGFAYHGFILGLAINMIKNESTG